jgi:hypothetical protein
MLSMQTVPIIRHKVLIEGLSVQQVARDLGLSRTTVYRYLERPEPRRGAQRPRPVLDATASRMDALLVEWQARTTAKQRRKRNKKVASKHGFEGAWERILAWHGWRVVCIGFPSWRTGPPLFPSYLALRGALDRDASNLFVTLPAGNEKRTVRGKPIFADDRCP